ncbi:MAG: hypothetical protein ACLFPJ_04110 [Candidatus Woesearchaeota archaeon]
MNEIKYPSCEKIIKLNHFILTFIKVKKADKSEVLSYAKLKNSLNYSKDYNGDLI